MFSSFMLNTWVAGTAVAVIAGVTGFFAVLRGSTFAAHAIPNGAFAGAAGASLLGLNPFAGLAVFSVAGALGIAGLSRRARSDVASMMYSVTRSGSSAPRRKSDQPRSTAPNSRYSDGPNPVLIPKESGRMRALNPSGKFCGVDL